VASIPTYVLTSQSGKGAVILDRVSLQQEVADYMDGASWHLLWAYQRLPRGERIDALDGSVVGVEQGVIIHHRATNKRFLVTADGEFVELPDEGWGTIPDRP
jgi:hypothetical protein